MTKTSAERSAEIAAVWGELIAAASEVKYKTQRLKDALAAAESVHKSGSFSDKSPQSEAEQAFHRPTWKAALMLAHNLCAQYSNRHNDNDETEQADALNEMCGHIRPYLDCTDEEIAEMVVEANPSEYVQQAPDHDGAKPE